MGILQVLRLEFQKFSILEILNFHPWYTHLQGDFELFPCEERSGLTEDRGVAGSSLMGATALCPWARHINPCLVLVQPRKTCPEMTEKLLTET